MPQDVPYSPPGTASRTAGDRAGDPVGVRVESGACRGNVCVSHQDAERDSVPVKTFGEQDGDVSSGAASATAKRARDGGSDRLLSEAKWRAVESERADGARGSAECERASCASDTAARNTVGDSVGVVHSTRVSDKVSVSSARSSQKEFLGVIGQGVGQEEKPPPHPFAP